MTFCTSERVAAVLGLPAPGAGSYTKISTDTRTIGPGDLFVALKGPRFDAHEFLGEAQSKGARAAVVRRGTAPVPGLIL